MDIAAYVLARCDRSGGPDACWLWQLSTASHGYGNAWDGTTTTTAHRLSYRAFVGLIPDGMTVDHRCRVKRCVNPRHLRLLTNEENGRDNGAARRPGCVNGHAWTPENTYVRRDTGARQCRACCRARKRRTPTPNRPADGDEKASDR